MRHGGWLACDSCSERKEEEDSGGGVGGGEIEKSINR